ncbi:MAG: diguanylate cyclase [Archangium sp.]|nr:diguanylate cyclase [Archangium sp.]
MSRPLALLLVTSVRDDLVTNESLRVVTAPTVGTAISAMIDTTFEAVVVDEPVVGEGFRGIVEHLAEQPLATRPVVLVRSADVARRIEALAKGADDVVALDTSTDEVLARIDSARRRLNANAQLLDENSVLRALSVTDGLTQVANHRAFQDRLRDEYRRAQRYDDPLGLILLDVDHFKSVNDRFGHQVGDDVLKQIAHAVKLAIRETDFVARYGGEEFAVLLPNTHLAGALTVAERISHDVRRLQLGSDRALRITASFGVSGFPSRAVGSPEQLVKTADDALYRAKNEGRNKISLHQASLLAV